MRFRNQALLGVQLPLLLAALTAGLGYSAFANLTVEAFPDPTDTQVQVITLYDGQPTEEVERRVSLPLERVRARRHSDRSVT